MLWAHFIWMLSIVELTASTFPLEAGTYECDHLIGIFINETQVWCIDISLGKLWSMTCDGF